MSVRGNFDHTGKLVKLVLRRERVISVIWLVILLLFIVGLVPALGNMFDSTARESLMDTVNNPSMIAMVGPVYGIDNYTAGALYSNMMLLWVIIAVAVMNIFLVVRHTRGDEERGRIEVVRSLPAGRLSNLHATMITAVIVNAILALLTGLGMAAMGVASMDFNGSMLFGVALGVSGLFFAGVAALFSQLSSSSRSAIGLSIVVMVILYLLRAVGDMNSETLALISPMGLILRCQVFVNNYWWPAIIVLIEAVVVSIVAYALNSIRDMDQGFIHARPGRREASKTLSSPFGLAYRLTRNIIIAWFICVFVLAAAYGSILGGSFDNFIANSAFYSQIVGVNQSFSMEQMFVTMVIFIMSIVALIPVLVTAIKMRGEEKDGRSEHVLARAVSRVKYMRGYVILSFVSGVLMQFGTAFGLYAAAASVMSDPGALTFGYLLKATGVYLPAIWVMTGVIVLLIGLVPKATGVIWAYFGLTFIVTFMGRLPNLVPDWVTKLTPYGFVPQLPVDEINFGTLGIMTAIAIILAAVGFIFYRKRDSVTA